ncbi:helix-turn-helix protein [Roseomonas sp. TAS13]|uniref:helix-turn-helix domain-containing protein n=1 Tax=Roseomonas sp. TAS13 TaxID=1926319 RepID=UPI000963DF98|nr:helix-turn-helix transcriptional regulator [Roseomonas sp. TAS13]GAV35464.1 helix-turn-helix protein [Roseomonas sp. TAS13]
MGATPVYHPPPSENWDPSASYPPDVVKAEFGRRLQAAMLARGWSQSELARRAGIGRDSISVYIRARSMPGPGHLNALAKALGTTAEELMPGLSAQTTARIYSQTSDHPGAPLALRMLEDGSCWLSVNQNVDFGTAVKIIELLKPAVKSEP